MEKLEKKVHELVMLGAAVGANCDTCWSFHYQEARKHGATHEETLLATEAAKEVRMFVERRLELKIEQVCGDGGLKVQQSSCCG